jgi:succinate dehydrogenase / fumarate reductase membrane anchor subunit
VRIKIAALDGDRGHPAEPYFAASVLSLATSDRKTAADWLSLPVPVLVAILVVLAGITHVLIGIR